MPNMVVFPHFVPVVSLLLQLRVLAILLVARLSDPICSLQEVYSDMAAISSSNTAFALELLRILSQVNPSGNIFVSPLSISSALAMVYLGAKGDTAAQMAQVGAPAPSSRDRCGALQELLRSETSEVQSSVSR